MNEKTALFNVAARFLAPEELEAFAAEHDPYRTWIHFVFTDDKPNANKQRVPKEEFASLVNTAKYMPIKKAVGGIGDTHDNAVPMGSIASAKIEESDVVSTIEVLATLWAREFPQDVEYLKQSHEDGNPINFSWEIGYTESKANDDNPEVEDLIGCRTRAATIVGIPAYQGRTQTLAMATEDFKQKYDDVVEFYTTHIKNEEYLITGIRDITKAAADEDANKAQEARAAKYGIQVRPDGCIEKPDEYAHLADSQFADPVNYAYPIDRGHIKDTLRYWGRSINKAKYSSASQRAITERILAAAKRHGVSNYVGGSTMDMKEIEALLSGLEPDEQAKSALDTLTEMFKDFQGMEDELNSLRTWKEEREKEDTRAVLLRDRLSALKEAGIVYSDEDLESNAEAIVSMDEDAFKFFLAQMAGKAKAAPKDGTAGLSVPDLSGSTAADKDDPIAILQSYLEEGDK